jgi:hypothetical protein
MAELESGPAMPATPDELPLELDSDCIIAALRSGKARPLSEIIIDIVTYRDAWWIAHGETWIQITDEATVVKLERHSDWANPRLLRDV